MTTVSEAAYVAEIEDARRRRTERLRGASSWFNVVGLHWLAEGTSTVGSDPANDIVVPGGPSVLGAIDVREGVATIRVASPDVTVDGEHAGRRIMLPDTEAEPTLVATADIRVHAILRQGRLALRVVDLKSSARRAFTSLDYFPVDPAWKLDARVTPSTAVLRFPTVLGGATSEEVAGIVSFERAGRTYELRAIRDEGHDGLFLIFGDETNAAETYPSGRYLYTPPVTDGRVTVDFNLALNPPCAFTHAATCSLPPPQNRLPIAISAGERRFLGRVAGQVDSPRLTT